MTFLIEFTIWVLDNSQKYVKIKISTRIEKNLIFELNAREDNSE